MSDTQILDLNGTYRSVSMQEEKKYTLKKYFQ